MAHRPWPVPLATKCLVTRNNGVQPVLLRSTIALAAPVRLQRELCFDVFGVVFRMPVGTNPKRMKGRGMAQSASHMASTCSAGFDLPRCGNHRDYALPLKQFSIYIAKPRTDPKSAIGAFLDSLPNSEPQSAIYLQSKH